MLSTYQIRNEKGLNRKVCQKAFLLIHGFGKQRLEVLRKKMPIGLTIPKPDCQGKHTKRPAKILEELREKIREHIMSFPTRQSHYSRHNNPGRLYLSPDLSIAKMYQMFLAKHDPAYVAHLERKIEALIRHEEACFLKLSLLYLNIITMMCL